MYSPSWIRPLQGLPGLLQGHSTVGACGDLMLNCPSVAHDLLGRMAVGLISLCCKWNQQKKLTVCKQTHTRASPPCCRPSYQTSHEQFVSVGNVDTLWTPRASTSELLVSVSDSPWLSAIWLTDFLIFGWSSRSASHLSLIIIWSNIANCHIGITGQQAWSPVRLLRMSAFLTC